jgi:hypothetical protein
LKHLLLKPVKVKKTSLFSDLKVKGKWLPIGEDVLAWKSTLEKGGFYPHLLRELLRKLKV